MAMVNALIEGQNNIGDGGNDFAERQNNIANGRNVMVGYRFGHARDVDF